MFPLLVYPLLCLGSFLVVFYLADNGLDLDLGQGTRETGIERKGIVRPHVSTFGVFR